MRSLSKHNVTPNYWGFNFRFVWFSGVYNKKFLKKLKKRIYRNKGHFRSLHMLLELCRKKEGNPFPTKIWVVGSYTDTLLNLLIAPISGSVFLTNFYGCVQLKNIRVIDIWASTAEISISNHTVFLVQFGINLHLWVFQKAKLHSPLINNTNMKKFAWRTFWTLTCTRLISGDFS